MRKVLPQTCLRLLSSPEGFFTTHGFRPARVVQASAGVALMFMASVSLAQHGVTPSSPIDPSKVIVKVAAVTHRFPPRSVLGTGFCLTSDCGFVVTSYHIATAANLQPVVGGERVVETDLATGPADQGAVGNKFLRPTVGHAMKYTPVRDLAILRMAQALAKTGMHGIDFYQQQLQYGQAVEIVGFTQGSRSVPDDRKLARFACTFIDESDDGLLEFKCGRSQDGEQIGPGESGGLVIDRVTQKAVGVLEWGGATQNNLAIAVPIWSLADFVAKFEPDVYTDLFSNDMYRSGGATIPSRGINVNLVLPDTHVPSDLSAPTLAPAGVPAGLLGGTTEEPPEIQRLRAKAQELAHGIQNFVATQTLSQNGGKNPGSWSQYEVTMVDGRDTYRLLPSGKRNLSRLPFPPSLSGVVIGREWADLPHSLGTNTELKLRRSQDKVENSRHIQVFSYRADIDDEVCKLTTVLNPGIVHITKSGPVACSGEVWTDDDLNILRITEDLVPPSGAKWSHDHTIITYGWLKEPGEAPKLVPATESFQSEYQHIVYWCKSVFADYREF